MEACFNMMVELCQNMACLSHGADPLYIWLHAKTQRAQHYYIKHAYGISEVYNTHSETNPWYGAGQGMGDACPRWIVQSDHLISAYKTQVQPWIMQNPDSTPAIEQAIDAFIDNTTLITGGQTKSVWLTLMQTAQENLLHWHHLLRASGGWLNPQKCSMSSFQWKYNDPPRTIRTNPSTTINPRQEWPTIHTAPEHHRQSRQVGRSTNCYGWKLHQGIRHLCPTQPMICPGPTTVQPISLRGHHCI